MAKFGDYNNSYLSNNNSIISKWSELVLVSVYFKYASDTLFKRKLLETIQFHMNLKLKLYKALTYYNFVSK